MNPTISPRALSLIFTTVALSLACVSGAETPEEKGRAIAERSDRSDRGFGDSKVDLKMTLRNKAGAESSRTLSLQTLEVPDEDLGDMSLIIFVSPKDIDGTALLSHAKILAPDDQWLYLPALKRTKRISSVNKSGPFVGSEFAFEDFTAQELNKYKYKWLREETLGGLACDVIERIPQYEYSGYTKQIAWIDQQNAQVRQVVYYNRRGDLLKTLSLEDYKQYNEKFWRAQLFRMVNHVNGKKTELSFGEYDFSAGLNEKDFDKAVLKRIR